MVVVIFGYTTIEQKKQTQRIYIVWFHLHKVQNQAKLIYRLGINIVVIFGSGEDSNGEKTEEDFGGSWIDLFPWFGCLGVHLVEILYTYNLGILFMFIILR